MSDTEHNFETLYKTFYKSLRNAAENIVRDPEAAHDIVQEVFVKLWHRKDDLAFIMHPKAYLYRSVFNTAITYLNNNKKKASIEDSKIEASDTSDSEILTKELLTHIEAAIEKLPPKCKAIFVLSRFEEMKYKEIAETLGLSLKTVENQMGIALSKLKEELKKYMKTDFFSWLFLAGLAAGLSSLG